MKKKNLCQRSMNNKTLLSLYKLMSLNTKDLKCTCGKKLIVGSLIDCYKQYILLEAKEIVHYTKEKGFGYTIYDTKSNKIIESYTALTLKQTIPKWENFKRRYEQKIL